MLLQQKTEINEQLTYSEMTYQPNKKTILEKIMQTIREIAYPFSIFALLAAIWLFSNPKKSKTKKR